MALSLQQKIDREIKNIQKLHAGLTQNKIKDMLVNIENSDEDFAYTLLLSWRRLVQYLFTQRDQKKVGTQILRKFNDAGRRSPPWKPGSARLGQIRPQDGADGNRQNRWLFDTKHEYYATKTHACFVELRYVFQILSMNNAIQLPAALHTLRSDPIYQKILGYSIQIGAFRDPLTQDPVNFNSFVNDRRYLESGHIIPLARGGKHTIKNATLMLRASNRLQADMTIAEVLQFMIDTLRANGHTVT